MNHHTSRGPQVDPAAVDAVLTASRSLIAVATKSLGAAAEETSIADILAKLPADAQGEVARALHAFADAAGELPDSQWPAA
jgi:hypothetical protein